MVRTRKAVWTNVTASEAIAARYLSRQRGTKVLRNGWPDFLVIDASGVYGVEVKTARDTLSPAQVAMHSALAVGGLPVRCLIVDGDRVFWKQQLDEHQAMLGEARILQRQVTELKEAVAKLTENKTLLEMAIEDLECDVETLVSTRDTLEDGATYLVDKDGHVLIVDWEIRKDALATRHRFEAGSPALLDAGGRVVSVVQ